MKKSIGQMMRKSMASFFICMVLVVAGIGLLPGLAMPVYATDPTESYNIQDDDVDKIYNEDCTIRIYGSGTETTNYIRIEVASEKTVTVILENVNINSGSTAFIISGEGDVHIELRGSNTLGSDYGAGLQKDNMGELIISGDGSLAAYGGTLGAGIGGGAQGSGTNIAINGGTVTATGGDDGGAGIGGGMDGSGTNIRITGGTVTATGGDYGGAGIGGGHSGSGSNIAITGGTVTAIANDGGAGIGGGTNGSGTNITISDGTVTATGGMGAAGIGGGIDGSGSNITITGGTVVSTGKYGGAGIGGGRLGNGGNITISGDSQVSVAGSAAHTDPRYAICGTGAGIGDGGKAENLRTPINGTEVSPDISRLLSTGRIAYYPAGTSAAGITSGNVQPVNTVIGTYVPSSGQNPGPSNPQTPSSNHATVQVDETPARTYIDVLEDRIRAMVALGGPQTIYWDEGTALSYSIMKLLEENPQITLVFSYSYDGADYKVTIPGKNVKTDPSIPWYGPLYLWANYRMYSGNGAEAEGSSQVTPDTTTATYTVVAGDTLSAIALRLNTTVEYLAYVNGIKNPDMIQIGQVIKY